MPKSECFKIINLDLERTKPFEPILDKTLQAKFGDYFKELTPEEIETKLMLSEDDDSNLYTQFMHWIELALNPDDLLFG